MRLFICEKPSQARDIAHAMDGSFEKDEGFLKSSHTIITWCFGHLLELAPPDDYCENLKPWRISVLPVIPERWVLQPQAKTKKQLTVIGKLLKKATLVVIATDADREGDVIGREVLDYFSYQGEVKRLWLSALDDASVKKALQDIRPGESTENLYQAGLGRSRADWLVGMNLTMATSCLFGTRGQGVLSVGRVQTPTLKLVVDRDKAIEAFKAKDYFILKAQFKVDTYAPFWMSWDIPEDLVDEEGRCINLALVNQVADAVKHHQGTISQFSETKKSQSAPLCLSLSALQKLASAKYGFGAKEVLDIAQALYETHKATTYPRTDCGYLPESQLSDAPKVLKALSDIDPTLQPLLELTNTAYQSNVWNDKKITAHHGIIPTLNSKVRLAAMSDKELKLYDVIRRYYIAQFLGTYDYLARTTTCLINQYQFSASHNTPLKPGFKQALVGLNEDDEQELSDELILPALQQGDETHCVETEVQSRKSKPPARFSEGTLIAAMKSIAHYVEDPSLKKVLKDTAGIGTEATRANILETLINRDYVAKKGKQLISTSKGRALIALLPDSITNPATTALWEQELDNIAEGKSDMSDFLDEQTDTLEGMIQQLEKLAQSKEALGNEVTHPCPDCKKPMFRRKGNKRYWWGCSGYPECKTTAFDEKGKPQFLSKTLNNEG
ncbi:DNA topoisomerase III [Legionella fairfieldensis]|uniref:DNA topoisomerase III n=1 Tax=Legionella fairfieldensis TaxID=45064 RepID=UPI000491A455|nr:DNA topoisomerase III [Legionella fairfieldensis]